MKKLFLFIALALGTEAFAQDAGQSTRLRNTTLTGYGVSSSKYTRFNGENAVVLGAYGGLLINHKLMVGLGGYGLLTSHDANVVGDQYKKNSYRMGYGGFVVEYNIIDRGRFHATSNVLLGGGAIINGHEKSRSFSDEEQFLSEEESGFLVAEPSVTIETDVTKWFRVGVGAGYRFVGSSNMLSISDGDLSGLTANLSLKFGVF
jgi:hypothetical protein